MEYFVISVRKSDGTIKYFSNKNGDCWSTFLGDATFYHSREEAELIVNGDDFVKEVIEFDYTIRAPRLIDEALDMSRSLHLIDSGTLYIIKVDLSNAVFTRDLEYEVIHPQPVHLRYM